MRGSDYMTCCLVIRSLTAVFIRRAEDRSHALHNLTRRNPVCLVSKLCLVSQMLAKLEEEMMNERQMIPQVNLKIDIQHKQGLWFFLKHAKRHILRVALAGSMDSLFYKEILFGLECQILFTHFPTLCSLLWLTVVIYIFSFSWRWHHTAMGEWQFLLFWWAPKFTGECKNRLKVIRET